MEKAVKHCISSSMAGGEIEVQAVSVVQGWTRIQVKNTGAPPKTPRDDAGPTSIRSKGTSLANARERLVLLYGRDHNFFFGLDSNGSTVVRFSVSGARLD